MADMYLNLLRCAPCKYLAYYRPSGLCMCVVSG